MVVLSVHLITYNNEKHIEETLQSILKQKVDFNYEIVVGDDCSTDDTLNIINKYQITHPKLFNLHKNEKQLGILGNFKATLDRCQGLYVFDIAGDDLLKSENALQKMVDVLKENNNLGFVDSGVDLLDEKKNLKFFINKNTLEGTKENYNEQLILGKIIPTGICFNKKFLYEFVDFKTYLDMKLTIEDYPILVDLAMNTDFKSINESLHIYRVHNNSYSHKKNFENHYFLKNQMKDLFIYFNNKYGFNQNTITTFNNNYLKDILFLAGYFQKKQIGKDIFKKIKSKNIKDYVHYFASQNRFFRKLVSIL